jgi:hypothetical protein
VAKDFVQAIATPVNELFTRNDADGKGNFQYFLRYPGGCYYYTISFDIECIAGVIFNIPG